MDDRGLFHVAAAVLEHVAEEYVELYRQAVHLQYTCLYLTEAIISLHRAGYDVTPLWQLREALLEERYVEDLDAFFDSRIGHAVCEILNLDPAGARKRLKEYVRQTVNVEEIKARAWKDVKRMCREALRLDF